jgi:DNA polymerase elongation subunit (family B)
MGWDGIIRQVSKMVSYNDAYYTIQDIRDAEEKTRGILGHDDIITRLEFLISRGIVEMPWFRFTDTERDIISDYCGIKPRFRSKQAGKS